MVMLFWTTVSGNKSSKVNLLAPHPKEGEEGGRALLWTECLCLHKIHMLQCDGTRSCGFGEGIRIRWGHREELPWTGSVPLGLRRELFPLLYSPSYENRSRRQQSITGKGPHQNPNMLVRWSIREYPRNHIVQGWETRVPPNRACNVAFPIIFYFEKLNLNAFRWGIVCPVHHRSSPPIPSYSHPCSTHSLLGSLNHFKLMTADSHT